MSYYFCQIYLDGDNILVNKGVDAKGVPWYEYKRCGYPPVIRRRILTAWDLKRVYKNDRTIRFQKGN